MVDSEHSVPKPIPNSPIGVLPEVGRTEVRRATALVEVYYRAEPDEFVDIQACIFNALRLAGGEHGRDLGDVIVAVDLTEHVRFVNRGEHESS